LSATYNYQPFNKLTNTATTSYVYNSNGNMVSKTIGANTTQFYWDYENRLKQVILPNSQSVVYKYDALGRRSERNVNNSTSWTKFTYDGQDVILDQNSDGTSVTYLNGLGIDNKIRQTVNGQAQYFLNDHLGSTNALTDATGTVISSTSYDSFGNATNASFPTRYQFTGREFDDLTGLHYYRARFYDANLGRFISEDPIGLRDKNMNLFGYVRNNPTNRIDPSGLIDLGWGSPTGPPIPYSSQTNSLPNRNLDCVPEECKKDINSLVEELRKARDEMNANGYRVPEASGSYNNIRSTINGATNYLSNKVGYGNVANPYKGCQDQALFLLNRLRRTPNYSTYGVGHDFGVHRDVNPEPYSFGPFTFTSHKWIKAESSNPKCPKIRLDVWADSWEIIP
jgi:RHS repeat-associated protein